MGNINIVELLVQPFCSYLYYMAKCVSGMFETLSSRELIKGLENQVYVVVDVREPEQFFQHHIPGALSIPRQEIVERLHEIPADKAVVFYCEDGKLAGTVTTFLKGYARLENLYTLKGGIKALEAVSVLAS